MKKGKFNDVDLEESLVTSIKMRSRPSERSAKLVLLVLFLRDRTVGGGELTKQKQEQKLTTQSPRCLCRRHRQVVLLAVRARFVAALVIFVDAVAGACVTVLARVTAVFLGGLAIAFFALAFWVATHNSRPINGREFRRSDDRRIIGHGNENGRA